MAYSTIFYWYRAICQRQEERKRQKENNLLTQGCHEDDNDNDNEEEEEDYFPTIFHLYRVIVDEWIILGKFEYLNTEKQKIPSLLCWLLGS